MKNKTLKTIVLAIVSILLYCLGVYFISSILSIGFWSAFALVFLIDLICGNTYITIKSRDKSTAESGENQPENP